MQPNKNELSEPFWRHKSLADMTDTEWESLCDGCGRCCLHKFEDIDSGELCYSRVACKLLDTTTCRCSNYPERQHLVPDCISLQPSDINHYHWLPPSCAYRLLAEGKDLPVWHPLRSGRSNSVHSAGVSVRDWAISETHIDDPEDYLIGQLPLAPL